MTEALPMPLPVEAEKSKITTSTSSGLSSLTEDQEGSFCIDPEIEKRVVRKCDLRVVPPTLVLFALSFLDRVNIGNAKIQGLTKDLKMAGTDYNIALLILFIPFILFEIPSNIIMKRLKPSTWLSILLFFTGMSANVLNLKKPLTL